MDPIFAPIFEQQVISLSRNDPYSWIRGLLGDIASRHIIPPMTLRADGELFLLGNIGSLVVIPWDGVHGQGNFKQSHFGRLADDMDVIIRDAVVVAQQKRVSEVSARTLLDATANRIQPLAVLSTNIWGP